jgi:sugar O-acyltransferase (sialic acid O-acetyltransferase NeuD family)
MSDPATPPVIILGGGGHARVVLDCLRLGGRRVIGFTAPESGPDLAPGVPWLGKDEVIAAHRPADIALVNGVGSTGSTRRRRILYEQTRGAGYRFIMLRHPAAILSTLDVHLGHGCQLLAGCQVGPGVRLGDNVLVNSRAVVEHDCRIETHGHIATGAILCGGCDIGHGTHVGAGATILQGIRIGNGAIIAAGAVVAEDVEPLTLVAGVPARRKKALNDQDLEGHKRRT